MLSLSWDVFEETCFWIHFSLPSSHLELSFVESDVSGHFASHDWEVLVQIRVASFSSILQVSFGAQYRHGGRLDHVPSIGRC